MRVAAVLLAVALSACSSEPDFSEDTVRGTYLLVTIDGQPLPVAAPDGQVESAKLQLGGCGNCSEFAAIIRSPDPTQPDGTRRVRYAFDLAWSVTQNGEVGVLLDEPGTDVLTPGTVTEAGMVLTLTDVDWLPDGEYLFERTP